MVEQVERILAEAPAGRPWRTARGLARDLGGAVTAAELEGWLLLAYRGWRSRGQRPPWRYSGLPARRGLAVLWASTERVGDRALPDLARQGVAEPLPGDASGPTDAPVFLSHSHRDYAAMRVLADHLVGEGVAVWMAETHIGEGEAIHGTIIDGLARARALLLFVSGAALRSGWTEKEFEQARGACRRVCVVWNLDDPEIAACWPWPEALAARLEGGGGRERRAARFVAAARRAHRADHAAFSRVAGVESADLPEWATWWEHLPGLLAGPPESRG